MERGLEFADGPRTLLRSVLPGNKHWNERMAVDENNLFPSGQGQQLLALAARVGVVGHRKKRQKITRAGLSSELCRCSAM